MARTPKVKKLSGTRLANNYGGWIYCENCGQNIGYLCYVTYDHFRFHYHCKCGARGSAQIDFTEESKTAFSGDKPVMIKNRLSCPKDQSPLLTVLEKKLDSYSYEIQCIACNTKYTEDIIL